MKIGLFAFKLFLFGLLAVIYFVFFGGFSAQTRPFRHVIPGSCIECVEYNPHAGLYPEPTPNIPGTGYPPSDASCPIDYSPLYCTQGPSGNVSGYHAQTKSIDVGTRPIPISDDVWHAPSDGKVIEYRPSNICKGTGADYGGVLKFADNNGNVYILLHVKAVKGVGPAKKGQAIAISRRDLTPDGWCWTGPHYHLEVLVKGSYVNAEDWYRNKLKCNLTSCQ